MEHHGFGFDDPPSAPREETPRKMARFGPQLTEIARLRPLHDPVMQSLRHRPAHPFGSHKGKVEVSVLFNGHETDKRAVSFGHPDVLGGKVVGPVWVRQIGRGPGRPLGFGVKLRSTSADGRDEHVVTGVRIGGAIGADANIQVTLARVLNSGRSHWPFSITSVRTATAVLTSSIVV